MIRLLHIYLPTRMLLLVACEVLVIVLGFLCTSNFDSLGPGAAGIYVLGISKVIAVAGVFTLFMWYFDLYDPLYITSRRELIARVPQVFGCATLAMILLYRIFPALRLGTLNFLFGMVTAWWMLVLCREGFLWFTNSHAMTGKVLILGNGTLAESLMEEIRNRPELGLEVAGCLNYSEKWRLTGQPNFAADTLAEAVTKLNAHIIVVALQDRRGHIPLLELLSLKVKGIRIEDGVEVYERVCGKIPVESLNPSALLFCKGFSPSKTDRFLKQATSVVFSIIGLLVLWPLMLVVAIAIKLESPGPVLLRQERVGEDGKSFTILKFRSMRQDAERDGPRWAAAVDSRITRVGAFIRRCRIDELPQFFNILRGEMYLIGPRPERPFFVERLRREIPFYDQRHVLKPGITGWAQLKSGYADSTAASIEKLQYDLYYIKHLSLGLDIVITLLTIKTMLTGRERAVRRQPSVESISRKEGAAVPLLRARS